ncbi:probable tRNA N6-adenosine threonylcarbamoyltransferase, mitochondrial isoform X1 [Daphnia pulex]|uniref:probable tRNA N6-adenosine threonylcarbamoyltransferase, mitochondrial isoform X1 n=2 Tax=Daphnia pulex TaxID=6669 RepID=UPI001EDE3553|nr:probable tRNA N6-adenosine threonylcarbamoyltransferase, mitochondrial isoform X1 [Daphnia pulex]
MLNLFLKKNKLFHLNKCYHQFSSSSKDIWKTNETKLRCFHTPRSHQSLILGIETSCDDTGAAIVDSKGNIIGEALHSQLQTHLAMGGIIPPIARDLHIQNISQIVETALQNANLKVKDLDAIAATVKPGMPLSLVVGTEFAKKLCKTWNVPFIPIHHMEAHALTARMVEKVDFPFLVLLVSGGHCLLAVAKNVDEFLLLGESVDSAPGEVLDKVARRLKLRNMPAFSTLSGGKAIEMLATQGDVTSFEYGNQPMFKYNDCSFSFTGLREKVYKHIGREEIIHNTEADQVLPSAANLCASFQHALFSHICRRLQRGMHYVDMKQMIPEGPRKLVVSGGVACNDYFRKYLSIICAEMSYTLVCPPPKLCTDNGIMIAWNGMEKWTAGIGIAKNADDIDAIDIEPKAKLGVDMTEDVRNMNISLKKKWIKLLPKKVNVSQ